MDTLIFIMAIIITIACAWDINRKPNYKEEYMNNAVHYDGIWGEYGPCACTWCVYRKAAKRGLIALAMGLALIGMVYMVIISGPAYHTSYNSVDVEQLSCPAGYEADIYYGFNAEYTIGSCTNGKVDGFDPIEHLEVTCFADVSKVEYHRYYVALDADGYMRCHNGVEMGR